MPSRRNRNGRNKQNSHVYQQPTPSSRPSPDIHPYPLPDDPGSGDDFVGHPHTIDRQSDGDGYNWQEELDGEASGEEAGSPAQVALVDIEADSDSERSAPPQSLPTPPLPEFSDIPSLRHPQPETPLSPLWDDTGTSNGPVHSPILSTLAGHGSRSSSSKNFFVDTFSRGSSSGSVGLAASPNKASSSYSPPSPTSAQPQRESGFRSTGAGLPSGRTRTVTTSPNDNTIDAVESADPAPFAFNSGSDRLPDPVNDSLLDSDLQQMEGTIRPSRRVASGYGYGFSVEDKLGDMDTPGSRAVSSGSSSGRRASRYEQSTLRGASALSKAMALPESGRPQRIPQYDLSVGAGKSRSSTIPVSINGAPDEGDTILSARWDYGLDGRRLLFLSYYPSGLQIWDCTDLGSISEILNLPPDSVRQLIANDSTPVPHLSEDSPPEMVVEYAGILTGRNEEGGPFLGILITPTDDKRDSVDEASDSILLTAEDEEVSRDPASEPHSFLLVYSLVDHGVIKRIRLPGLCIGGGRFEVGNGFVVVSTTIPPALHVLSSMTFDVLHHITSNGLVPFCHKSPSSSSLSPSLSSRRHSFLETTSNIVNGIYNNYNDHFNDNYYHNHNNRISERNNVSLPPVDQFSSSSTTASRAVGGYPGGQSSDYNRQRRDSMHGQASQQEAPSMSIPQTIPLPAPVFSVSGRLLAYASVPEGNSSHSSTGVQLRTTSTLSSAAVSTASAFGSSLSAQLANLGGSGGATSALGALGGISQADVGNAALKVGGSVLSGMKTLGGLALKTAVAATADSGTNANLNRRTSGNGGVGGLANRFFSRSAPAATSPTTDRDRRYSTISTDPTGIEGYEDGRTVGAGQMSDNTEEVRRPTVPPRTVPVVESGYHVTVLDFASMAASRPSQLKSTAPTANFSSPSVIMQFVASKTQPISNIWFSSSGTSLLVAPRDGQTVQVYEVRSDPVSRMIVNEGDVTSDGNAKASGISTSKVSEVSPLHVYNLRRGRTPAVIESADWATDGRWLAIGTRKRTVHVFAVNPYGGPSDIPSHIDGRVKNLSELPPTPLDMHPLVRLRVSKFPSPEQPQVPLAFTFLESPVEAERRLPPNLLPPISSPHLLPTTQHSYGSVNSTHTVISSSPSTRSEVTSVSPRQQLSPSGRPRNFQDVLVFDPTDGVLSLRRITTDIKSKAKDGPSIFGASLGSVSSISVSRSLPGSGTAGRLSMSASPSTSPVQRTVAPGRNSPLTVEGTTELVGRENAVASWNLRRGKDWSEKKGTVETSDRLRRSPVGSQTNWLSQAELSTYSKSTRVFPRSIYLSHQFSFRALGEDYHALIRRYQFDIGGTKIDVRKGVEVSAYTGSSESFVEGGSGFASRRDRRRLSSSFDEPLASALLGGMDYTPSQPVLPMFPNGVPGAGSKPRSFKNSIPIRTVAGIGDGVSGRLRREINKVRSPQLRPTSDNSLAESVPLEFDEEDEDFVSREAETQQVRIHSQQSFRSVSSGEDSSTRDDAVAKDDKAKDHVHDEGDQWPGWVGDDRKAVEEAETFDDISAVGFMDEEIQAAAATKPGGKKKKKHNKST